MIRRVPGLIARIRRLVVAVLALLVLWVPMVVWAQSEASSHFKVLRFLSQKCNWS